jgi:hypothetical protein
MVSNETYMTVEQRTFSFGVDKSYDNTTRTSPNHKRTNNNNNNNNNDQSADRYLVEVLFDAGRLQHRDALGERQQRRPVRVDMRTEKRMTNVDDQ